MSTQKKLPPVLKGTEDLLTVSEFAKMHNVAYATIVTAINNNRINVTHIGRNRLQMIDPKLNQELSFKPNKKRV